MADQICDAELTLFDERGLVYQNPRGHPTYWAYRHSALLLDLHFNQQGENDLWCALTDQSSVSLTLRGLYMRLLYSRERSGKYHIDRHVYARIALRCLRYILGSVQRSVSQPFNANLNVDYLFTRFFYSTMWTTAAWRSFAGWVHNRDLAHDESRNAYKVGLHHLPEFLSKAAPMKQLVDTLYSGFCKAPTRGIQLESALGIAGLAYLKVSIPIRSHLLYDNRA